MLSAVSPSSARARVRAAAPDARVVFAPGRVNLIGDHVDYLGGPVLPMSIDRGTAFAFLPVATPELRIHALDRGEWLTLALDTPVVASASPDWQCFVAGLLALGPRTTHGGGGEIHVSGDLVGGGLSSSASFCVGLARVLEALQLLAPLEPFDRARLAQRVEHEFVGVQCGLMDQLAVVSGTDDGAVAIDCAEHRLHPVSLGFANTVVLALRSRGDRTLAAGGYNERRAELAEGLERLGQAPDRIPPEAVLERCDDSTPLRRVRHVVTEAARVAAAIRAAEEGDAAAFGALMTASHASLRDDYAVSTAELDAMVGAARADPGCFGARLTGAGFGGWAIALVREDAVDGVVAAVGAARGAALDTDAHFVARPGGAVRILGDRA